MSKFVFYTPFTGLGLYGGFRGNRWLRNRIKIFKQFVIPSLLNQSDRDFVHWISWRPEEKRNRLVIELEDYLKTIPNYKFVFTYGGVCFYDDKYKIDVAKERLFESIFKSTPYLYDVLGDCEEIQVILQPSDDIYTKDTVKDFKGMFSANKKLQALTLKRGYLCNYLTKELLEYNPKTNPPFYAVRFPREVFFDPRKHLEYISLKKDVVDYPKGTPQPSHEYLPDCFSVGEFKERGFLVGTHQENISTHFNHPYGGRKIEGDEYNEVMKSFGILEVPNLVLPRSLRKWILRRLSHKTKRKLRYWFGEKLYQRWYEFIRS